MQKTSKFYAKGISPDCDSFFSGNYTLISNFYLFFYKNTSFLYILYLFD